MRLPEMTPGPLPARHLVPFLEQPFPPRRLQAGWNVQERAGEGEGNKRWLMERL